MASLGPSLDHGAKRLFLTGVNTCDAGTIGRGQAAAGAAVVAGTALAVHDALAAHGSYRLAEMPATAVAAALWMLEFVLVLPGVGSQRIDREAASQAVAMRRIALAG